MNRRSTRWTRRRSWPARRPPSVGRLLMYCNYWNVITWCLYVYTLCMYIPYIYIYIYIYIHTHDYYHRYQCSYYYPFVFRHVAEVWARLSCVPAASQTPPALCIYIYIYNTYYIYIYIYVYVYIYIYMYICIHIGICIIYNVISIYIYIYICGRDGAERDSAAGGAVQRHGREWEYPGSFKPRILYFLARTISAIVGWTRKWQFPRMVEERDQQGLGSLPSPHQPGRQARAGQLGQTGQPERKTKALKKTIKRYNIK